MMRLIKYCKNNFLIILLLLTPVVDNINGLFLINHGVTGISIGTFFRILIILYCIAISYRIKRYFIAIYLLSYFPILALLKGMFSNDVVNDLTYAMKWVMVALIILALLYKSQNDTDIFNEINVVFHFWVWFVPTMLILEYIFNIGNKSYWDTGFKGLYYSTNDLAYVLIVLFIYSVYQLIYYYKFQWIIIVSLNLIAILILGTKSSIFFAIFTAIFLFLFHSNSISNLFKKIVFAIIIYIIFYLLIKFMGQNIQDFINRYSNLWLNSQNGEGFWNSFLIFATSGRTQRISDSISQLYNGNFFLNILFGWIKPDNANVVEMDLHDLLFQYGTIGFLILSWFYLSFANLRFKKDFNIKYLMIISCIYAIFAGHVISGAFSGTMFAMVYFLFSESGQYKFEL